MSMSVEQITDEMLALPSEARALLADRLVERLDHTEDGYIHQLWAAEVRRCLDDVRSGRVKTIPSEEVYPEFIQSAATPKNLSRAALELLQDKSRRAKIKSQLAKIISSLGEPGAAGRAAAAILSLFK